METDIDKTQSAKKNLCILFLHFFNRGEAPLVPCTGPSRNAHLFVADATDRDDDRPKALVNAAKFAAACSRITILAGQLNQEAQLFEIMALFFLFVLPIGSAQRAKIDMLFDQPSKSGECLDFSDDTEKKMPLACAGFVYLAIPMASPIALAASAIVI